MDIQLPQGYEPSEDETYMNSNQMQYFKNLLLQWKKKLIEESNDTIKHLQEEEYADDTELRQRNKYLKLQTKIDKALKRIEDQEYGFCEETGEPIGLKRLKARPIATLSIEAQERHENYERTHAEEDEY